MDEKINELEKAFKKKFGDNWRKDIKLQVRADTLYWFVYLVNFGIDAKQREFQKVGSDAASLASLASWRYDIENIIDNIIATIGT